jgi:lysocardiolipin and lysophospholipid acyltransferase
VLHSLSAFSAGTLDAIYDVTVAYPDHMPEKEEDLKHGKIPREVHFHIKR